MSTDFKLPELGENITAGDVVRVLVAAGDTVSKDQPVLELETDKATIEVPSSVSGTVKEIRIKQGERVEVGQVVLTVDDAAGATNGKGAKAASAAADKPKALPTGAPEEGGLSQQAPEAGPLSAGPRDVGGAARASAERDLGRRDDSAPQAEPVEAKPKRGEVVDISRAARSAAPSQPQPEAAPAGPIATAAPSVRRLARELGVDIQRVAGSGPGSWCLAFDLPRVLASRVFPRLCPDPEFDGLI